MGHATPLHFLLSGIIGLQHLALNHDPHVMYIPGAGNLCFSMYAAFEHIICHLVWKAAQAESLSAPPQIYKDSLQAELGSPAK
jgi:hypothetical protein